MDDYTWLFYMPLIFFFIVLVGVSVSATYRQRALQRRYQSNQMPVNVVSVQQLSQPQQPVMAQQVYVSQMQYPGQMENGYKYPNAEPVYIQPVHIQAQSPQPASPVHSNQYTSNSSPIIR